LGEGARDAAKDRRVKPDDDGIYMK